MDLEIRQKYWTIGDKFALTDHNGNPLYYATNKVLKLRANLDLFDLSDRLLYHMEARLAHMFSYYVIIDGSGKEIGFIDEKIHMPGFRRAKMQIGDVQIKLKGGPIHMKAMIKDAQGKWLKRQPAVSSKKKLFHIVDVYRVHIDEQVIDASLGALVALWYDKVRYGHKH